LSTYSVGKSGHWEQIYFLAMHKSSHR
jgi:hypothetical protein